MKMAEELQRELRSINRKSYPAYKGLKGAYQFPDYQLFIEHVQGDPFAAPSALRIFVQRMCAFQSLSGIRHRLREIGTVIFQHRQRQVTAVIQRIQRHAAQVVIER